MNTADGFDLSACAREGLRLLILGEDEFRAGAECYNFPWPTGAPDLWDPETIIVARIFEGAADSGITAGNIELDGLDGWISRWEQSGLSPKDRVARLIDAWRASQPGVPLEEADEQLYQSLRQMWKARLRAWRVPLSKELLHLIRGSSPTVEFSLARVVEHFTGSTDETYVITRISGNLLLGSVRAQISNQWSDHLGWGGYHAVPQMLFSPEVPPLRAASLLLENSTFGPGWLETQSTALYSSSPPEDVYRLFLAISSRMGYEALDLTDEEVREVRLGPVGFIEVVGQLE